MAPRLATALTDRLMRPRSVVGLAVACGFLLSAGVAEASSWTIGISGTTGGEAVSGTLNNLTIAAVATPAPTNVLYPGSDGDVVLTITNSNNYPVTISALQFPSNLTGATGYTNSNLSTANTNCTALLSGVTWVYSTLTAGASHTLTTPLVVGASGNANNPLTVTLTNFATMSSSSPIGCASTYFSMPVLNGVTASAGGTPVTTSPATDT